jgi:type IV fimbrial biogenesis protein FimT
MLDHEKRRYVLSAFHKARHHGFSLIELMIGIAIFSITLTFGVSSYRTWVQNTQIRNAAESIQNGIQRARAEAVKRNANVAFALGVNSSWQISLVSDGSVIDSRSSGEGSKNVTVSALDKDGNDATTITLSNLGAIVANADASESLAEVDLDSSVLDPADSRDLRITIGLGGIVRMCDPNLAAGSSPSAC